MGRSSVELKRTGNGAPVWGFVRAPGVVPVACTRIDDAVTPAMAPHAHDFLVLCYANRADGSVVIDGRTWTVDTGDLFVLGPGQVVGFTGRGHVIEDGWVVWFPADVVRTGAYASWRTHPLLFPFARGADRAQRLRVPPAGRDALVGAFAGLDAELRDRRDGYQEAVLARLTLLLVDVGRLSADVAGQLRSSDEPLLAAVFDVIERRYPEPVSLADIAAELALTGGHLTTVVRRRTGRTVQQWITQRRLQEARVLLSETGLTVAAISRRVGYPDVGYFIKRFRAEHGTTPARWRTARP